MEIGAKENIREERRGGGLGDTRLGMWVLIRFLTFYLYLSFSLSPLASKEEEIKEYIFIRAPPFGKTPAPLHKHARVGRKSIPSGNTGGRMRSEFFPRVGEAGALDTREKIFQICRAYFGFKENMKSADKEDFLSMLF